MREVREKKVQITETKEYDAVICDACGAEAESDGVSEINARLFRPEDWAVLGFPHTGQIVADWKDICPTCAGKLVELIENMATRDRENQARSASIARAARLQSEAFR